MIAHKTSCAAACRLGLLLLLLAACQGPNGEAVGSASQAILNGSVTSIRTGVGRIQGPEGLNQCTATLISSRVILSAARCFGFDTSGAYLGDGTTPPSFPTSLPPRYFFIMHNPMPPSGQPADLTRTILRYAVLATTEGANDLAVAELNADVPIAYASPLKVATGYPANGASLLAYGHGCTSGSLRGTGGVEASAPPFAGSPPPGWAGTSSSRLPFKNAYYPTVLNGGTWAPTPHLKTRVAAQWDAANKRTTTNVACQHDWGGPILFGDTIVAVHSIAYGNAPGETRRDRPADAIANRLLIDKMNALFGTRQFCTSCPQYALRAQNGSVLQAHTSGAYSLTATGSPAMIGHAETFQLLRFSAGPWYALQAANGRWVSASASSSAVTIGTSRPDTTGTYRVDTLAGVSTFKTIGSPARSLYVDQGIQAPVVVGQPADPSRANFSLLLQVPQP